MKGMIGELGPRGEKGEPGLPGTDGIPGLPVRYSNHTNYYRSTLSHRHYHIYPLFFITHLFILHTPFCDHKLSSLAKCFDLFVVLFVNLVLLMLFVLIDHLLLNLL